MKDIIRGAWKSYHPFTNMMVSVRGLYVHASVLILIAVAALLGYQITA